MPKRIDAHIDLDILADIGLGIPSTLLAKKYNVSPSYISKLKQGHKVPLVRVVTMELLPIVDLLSEIARSTSTMAHADYLNYIEQKIKEHTTALHLYHTVLKYYTKEYLK